ncbi:MAG: prepilin-type N-terminal cleavage/methylation domain-containing protein [Oligoflexus sp.]|nr:prepilin-type N-terminal cleavage/methylation domain-containing protein [Oligoflexus sp.]
MTQPSPQSGFSLIEVLVALAITGLLTVLGNRFLVIAEEGRVSDKSRLEADTNKSQLQLMIERDLQYRLSDTSFSVSPDQKTLTLTRLQTLDVNHLDQADTSSYEIRYATTCKPTPPSLDSYPALSVQLNGSRFQNKGDCLRIANCPAGQLPGVDLTVIGGGRIPAYPSKIFPQPDGIAQSPRNHAVAAAACFMVSAQHIRVMIDSVYIVAKDQYAGFSQDKFISIQSNDVRLLPK